jgi:hypothetical protein
VGRHSAASRQDSGFTPECASPGMSLSLSAGRNIPDRGDAASGGPGSSRPTRSRAGNIRTMTTRLVIVAAWIVTVTVTVLIAFATRSHFAEVNPIGGVFIVAGCAAVAGILAALMRPVVIFGAVAAIATTVGSLLAWNVLHDESSTAAIGVIGPPLIDAFIAFVGLGIAAVSDRSRAR